MGDWKLIVPEATENLITNPSFEEASTGWSTGGTNTIGTSNAFTKFGKSALRCTYVDANVLAQYSITLPTTSTDYAFSVYVYIPSSWDGGAISLDIGNLTGATITDASTTTEGEWVRLEAIITVAADAAGLLFVRTASAPSGGTVIYMDAAQCEEKAYATTYCDGDQEGCEWTGAKHGSASTRSARSRAGGRVMDFKDDLGLEIMNFSGVGAPPVNHRLLARAGQDGASYQGTTLLPAEFALLGAVNQTTQPLFHSTRQTLVQALLSRIETVLSNPEGVLIRYTGAAVDKEIAALYNGGLEISAQARYCLEDVPLRFIAPDPLWRQVGEKNEDLVTWESDTVRLVAGRVDGIWSALGPPDSAGTYSAVHDIAVGLDRIIYFGGDFLNFDNRANCDYIAQWGGSAWASLGTGMDGVVNALFVGPDGSLYAGGAFTTAGGTTCRGIAVWDGSAWAALGPPSSGGTINSGCIVFDSAGNLYVAGNFTNWDGTANADYIAKWDGSAWSALSTGADDIIRALAIDENDNIYAVGDFLNIGGVAANRVAKWDGSAWTALGTGLNGVGRAAIIGSDGILYVGGDFTTAGGNTCTRIARWNGAGWSALGDGCNNSVYTIIEGPGGVLYVGGTFTSAGGLTLTDRLAIWNGATWAHPDIDLPGSATVFGIAFDGNDLYIGFNTTGAAYYSSSIVVTYGGTARAYPFIIFELVTGAGTLQHLENLGTGARVYLDYPLQEGEVVTVDFRPGKRGLSSSFWGRRNKSILPSSDMARFFLAPAASGSSGDRVSCFVSGGGAYTAHILWQDAYMGVD